MKNYSKILKAKYFVISMAPENDLLSPLKQLHLLMIQGKEREGEILTNETTYNKDTFDAGFSFIKICS